MGSADTPARLVIHGGSGEFVKGQYPPERITAYRRGLENALRAGNDILRSGGNALDAVVAAVKYLEDDPIFNASKGAVFNIAGKHELEASVAVSQPPAGTKLPANRRGAAVTLLTTVKNPILLAKELYMDADSCPHPFVSGPDAERIAKGKGLDIVDEHYFDTDERWKEHQAELAAGDPFDDKAVANHLVALPKGTVGAVALDSHGMLACATSTGGKTNKNVGRIGDTPSFGSGFACMTWLTSTGDSVMTRIWQRLSGQRKSTTQGVAVSGTGDGDYFIRNSTAFDVVARMRYLGVDVKAAGQGAIDFIESQEGRGGLIALDLDGRYAMPFFSTAMCRGTITASENVPRVAIWPEDGLEILQKDA